MTAASQPVFSNIAEANQLVHGVDTHYRVEESFDDFRTTDGLTLPSHWNLHYSREGTGAEVIECDVRTATITHNNVVE